MLRYVKTVIKIDDIPALSKILIHEIEPLIEQSKDYAAALARFLYIRQMIFYQIDHIEFSKNTDAIQELYAQNPEVFEVAKYFVKIIYIQ